MGTRLFTVDARLLRELGERLVGRPHIALAELIKNSYDADARHVELTFEGDRIAIADDGHGMTENDFTERWMRIGTTIKNDQKLSPALLRPLTGSKGVGRLAVQLLAERLDLHTVGLLPPLLWRMKHH
ncbi:ATP-binding protein [Ornithinimicrobium sp. INDO-MA30-4]|uniref:ATP-binding protein n=1 Tax=Ornithinimicrobium sp. INDO-MA30-4 TaxID=2908651 RepID=UPI001F2ABBDD|nr:ATP-binding protein [Ornithinimicrobium sp. INDO-MA30-4]UJH71739.1 ATP-binding protein [Ornithinimicrobium sp. INDO-MA30-4]